MRRRRFDTASSLAHWQELRSSSRVSGESYALFHGDAIDALRGMPDGSVNTCITSPPYWGVRDYEENGQLGAENSVDEYVKRLVDCFREVKRVLRPEGTAWLNLGDKYLNGVGTEGGRPPSLGWKRNKQLSLVPFRVALALQEDGWWVRNSLVWSKPNAMPISATDRLANQWEPVFLLTRDEYYFFDLDKIRVPHKTDDGVERLRAQNGLNKGKAAGQRDLRRWLNSPRHRATIDGVRDIGRRPNAPDPVELAAYLRSAAEAKGLSINKVALILDQPFERVRHYFRTDRIGSRLPPESTWEALKELLDLDAKYDEAMEIEYGDNIFRNHPNGRNPGDVHSFAVAAHSGDHFATMPLSLAKWCLSATLPEGGVCLDPFMGHGTSGEAALQMGGRFVGVDLVEGYVKEAAEKLKPYDEIKRSAAE